VKLSESLLNLFNAIAPTFEWQNNVTYEKKKESVFCQWKATGDFSKFSLKLGIFPDTGGICFFAESLNGYGIEFFISAAFDEKSKFFQLRQNLAISYVPLSKYISMPERIYILPYKKGVSVGEPTVTHVKFFGEEETEKISNAISMKFNVNTNRYELENVAAIKIGITKMPDLVFQDPSLMFAPGYYELQINAQ
jgi:hypothetical protein